MTNHSTARHKDDYAPATSAAPAPSPFKKAKRTKLSTPSIAPVEYDSDAEFNTNDDSVDGSDTM